MFTKATKGFGVWKEERKNTKINYHILSRNFFISLAFAAFVSWITLIITLKIKHDFFVFETSPRNFTQFKSILKIKPGFYFSERKSALSIYTTKISNDRYRIFFESGKGFELPNQGKEFLNYLEEKRQNIMLTSMLMRIEDPSISRVKIWTDSSMSFENIKYIIKIFSSYGYDDFDIAIER